MREPALVWVYSENHLHLFMLLDPAMINSVTILFSVVSLLRPFSCHLTTPDPAGDLDESETSSVFTDQKRRQTNKKLSAIKYSKAVTVICSRCGENTTHNSQSFSHLSASRPSCLLSWSHQRGVMSLPGGLTGFQTKHFCGDKTLPKDATISSSLQ